MPTPNSAILLALTLLVTPTAADWSDYAGRDDVCLVVHELESGREFVSNPERCDEPRRPYSTFKIANALLGLETGLLADADSVMRYNAARYPAEDWWPAGWDRHQPLRRAINMSAVPLFRQLAADIGPARMRLSCGTSTTAMPTSAARPTPSGSPRTCGSVRLSRWSFWRGLRSGGWRYHTSRSQRSGMRSRGK